MLENEVPKFVSFLNVLYPNDEVSSDEYIRGLPVNFKTIPDDVILITQLTIVLFLFSIMRRIEN